MDRDRQKVSDYTLKHLATHLMANPGRSDDLVGVLTKVAFLEAKAKRGMVYDLVEDFTQAVNRMPKEHLWYEVVKLLEEAIRRDVHFIERHPTTLFQCLWNSCWWYDCPGAEKYYKADTRGISVRSQAKKTSRPKVYEMLEQWLKQKKRALGDFYWMRSLRPPSPRLGGAIVTKLEGHRRAITDLAISANGERILSASYDEVRIWDAGSGQEVKRIGPLDGESISVGFLEDGTSLIARVVDTNVVVLDHAETGDELGRISIRAAGLESLRLSKDGRLLVVVLESGSVQIWDWQKAKRLACVHPPAGKKLRAVAVSADSTHMTAACDNHTVSVWKIGSGTRVARISQVYGVVDLDISDDGKQVVWGSWGNIVLFDVKQGKQILHIEGPGGLDLISIALSSHANVIVSGKWSGEVDVWDTKDGTRRLQCIGHEDGAKQLAISRHGRFFVSGSYDNTIRIWRLGGSGEPTLTENHTDKIWRWETHSGGKRIVSGSFDSTIRVWSSKDGVQLFCLKDHKGPVRDIWATSSKSLIFSYADDKTIRAWDVVRGKLKFTIRTDELISSMSVSGDCRYIAAALKDMTIRVWSVADQSQQVCFQGHGRSIPSIVFSPDGNLLASVSEGEAVQIWDLRKKKRVGVIYDSTQESVSEPIVRFFPDGRRIAFTWEFYDVRIWDVEKRKELARLRGHEDSIQRIAVSEDGNYVVTMSENYRVIAWDTSTFQIVEDFIGYLGGAGDVKAIGRRGGRFEWRAIQSALETSITSLSTDQEIAWCPTRYLSVLPSGDKWVSFVANELRMYVLEGKRHGRTRVRKAPSKGPVKGDFEELTPPARLVMRSSAPKDWI